jgi:hypothetical protein
MPPSKSREADDRGSGLGPSNSDRRGDDTISEASKPVRDGSQDQSLNEKLRFKIEGVSRDVREAFELWRLSILRRYHQLQIRAAKGYMPDYAKRLEALRDEWRLWRECLRLAAWGIRP